MENSLTSSGKHQEFPAIPTKSGENLGDQETILAKIQQTLGGGLGDRKISKKLSEIYKIVQTSGDVDLGAVQTFANDVDLKRRCKMNFWLQNRL